MPEIRTAELLYRPESDALRFLPEGPYPTHRGGEFSWVAIQHSPESKVGSLNLLTLGGTNQQGPKNQTFELPGRPGFAFACDDGLSFVVGVERSLGRFTPQTGVWEEFCSGIDEDVDNTIINDAMIWEDNLVFGTKDLEFKTRKAGLYLYRGADKKLIRLLDDQICSNGKAIRVTDGGLELIDIDSPTRQIVAYDIDINKASLGDRRVLVDITGDPAVPDGAVLTPAGDGVIVSMFNPEGPGDGETRLYSLRDGSLKTVWRTPGSPQNTCPNLIAHDGRVALVITTAVENMSDKVRGQCPNAGCLFIAETDFEKPTPMPIFPA
jgi:sugar lactone lactonase YvrE